LKTIRLNIFVETWKGRVFLLFNSQDTDTRRRSASDLVRGLVEHFAQQVTEIFGGYVSKFLEEYTKDPINNWKLKDTALYLVISLSARGVLPQTGAVSLNEFVPLLPIFQSNIVPELQSATDAGNPIVKVDCIKFLVFHPHPYNSSSCLEATCQTLRQCCLS
jgi:hypothetical protein